MSLLTENKTSTISFLRESNFTKGETPSISTSYHRSELNHQDKILNNAIAMIWAGIVIIAIGIIMTLTGKAQTVNITTVAGIIIDFLSSTIIAILSASGKSKEKYYDKLAAEESEKRLMSLVSSSTDEAFRKKMIGKIVDSRYGLSAQKK